MAAVQPETDQVAASFEGHRPGGGSTPRRADRAGRARAGTARTWRRGADPVSHTHPRPHGRDHLRLGLSVPIRRFPLLSAGLGLLARMGGREEMNSSPSLLLRSLRLSVLR